uniref:SET domain-containing protein n=1 Tax=Attheya septentrionalis TaxID=420275 RepID=A0A7S2XJU9_9STRA|mmetsp:Transcript_15408/g.27974  ORF Transcript_15408/g.27974 Transcript_15408/m.27974 type:complete len:544 (+) Transcript_15408:136-1767(+)
MFQSKDKKERRQQKSVSSEKIQVDTALLFRKKSRNLRKTTTMTHWRLLLVVLLGIILCIRAMEPMEETADMASSTSTSTPTCEAENPSSCEAETANDTPPKLTKEDDMYEKLIEWIRSHKLGIVSEKLEIRRADPEDASSGYGLFVKESVKKGELLYSIPWDLIITPDTGSYEATSFSCGTTRTLIQEAKKGNESSFYPYMRVFEEWDRYKAPLIEDWTEPGKDLLETITGTRLPPQNWREDGYWIFEWHKFCAGGSDELSEKAAMFVETRAEDALLVPLFDMSNHANGKAINVVLEIEHLEFFDGLAHRDIEAGEQLNHSYNLCENCGSRITSGYGTPQLFRDYGFVEQYPQRWNFGEGVRFDMNITPDKKIGINWITGFSPTRRGGLILEEEKDRLDRVLSVFMDLTKDHSLPTHEYETCKRYLHAVYTAVYSACATIQMDFDEKASKENDKLNVEDGSNATMDEEPSNSNSDTKDNNSSDEELEDAISEDDVSDEELEDDDSDEELDDDDDYSDEELEDYYSDEELDALEELNAMLGMKN